MASESPSIDVDPDVLFDRLVDADVLAENEDGTVKTTPEFEDTRAIYHDTYGNADVETRCSAVADLFGIDVEEAKRRVEEHGIDNDDLVVLMSVYSHVEDATPAEIAVMAEMAGEVAPASPVPDGIRELSDDDYEAFFEANPDAVVTVWKMGCDPCRAMKPDLEAFQESLPAGVPLVGVDGDEVPEFRREFAITDAPTTLFVRDGEEVERKIGRILPDSFAELVEEQYD